MQAFSAPGKALLAGGYLVLYPEYAGNSIALSSRMHSVVGPASDIIVESPQFDSKWVYSLETGKSTEQPHRNPFIEAVVATCRAYYGPTIKGAHITIWSDQGFHSQPPGASDRFTMHKTHITNVPKTGLGSSAALTVVAVAAIVRAQGACASVGAGAGAAELSPTELNLIHNLSQVAHSLSQGKVGSGFDVATAVYGSINYSRFPADLVDLELRSTRELCDSKWNFTADPVSLPPTVRILMGDVNTGSETPSMVRKVLAWRQSDPDAEQIWNTLNSANLRLTELLTSNQLGEVPAAIERIRKSLRLVSKLANVPVEPPQQTELLDKCTRVDGVLGGIVPGAGGSDAVCLLVETSKFEGAKHELEVIDQVKWLDLHQENAGLQVEDPGLYAAS